MDANTLRQGCDRVGESDWLRQAYVERRYGDAWAEYRRLAAAGPVPADVHLIGARAAERDGNLYAARHAIDGALGADPQGALRVEALFTRGVILLLIGDSAGALDDLQATVAGLEHEPNLGAVMLGPAYYNLALAFRQRRRYAEALDHYRVAIERFRAEAMHDHLRMALQNLAWVCCVVQDADGARSALDEAGSLCRSAEAMLLQQIHEAFLGSVVGGECARDAMATCERILSDSGDVPAGIRSHACWVAGRIALQMGQLEAAEALAGQAVTFGLQAREDHHSLLDASELLREVRQARVRA